MDDQVLDEVRRLTAAEDDLLVTARERADDVTTAPSPEFGALLRWSATTCGARAAVEVGSAAGVSGLWILRALATRGVLTSIEPDPHIHGLATRTFEDVEGGSRVRSILGDPATVLPRLSDGAYDLALLQTDPEGYPDHLGHVRRLLRPGGILIARGVLRRGDAAESLARFVQDLADDAAFSSVVLPVEDGLALATRAPDAGNGAES